MELNITSLAQSYAPEFSGSRMELGDNAAQITWRANLDAVNHETLVDTEEKRQAARDHFREYGAWTREEIDAWNDTELNALVHQDVMSNVREAPACLPGITFREEGDGWYYDDDTTPDFETGPFPSRSEAYQDASPAHRYISAESLDEIDWQEYEVMAEAGRISSRIFRTEAGEYYFYLGL